MPEATVDVFPEESLVNTKKQAERRFNAIRKHWRPIVALGSVALLSLGTYKTDFFGRRPHRRTAAQMRSIALASFESEFKAVSPAAKFADQFLVPDTFSIHEKTGGKGILGVTLSYSTNYTVGSDCLSGTAYDINDTTARPAVADVSPNQAVLSIAPAGNPAHTLYFSNLTGDLLKPADAQTANTLKTYGCDDGNIPVVAIGED